MNFSGMSNLQTRIVSGVILAAIVLVVTFLGGLPFRLLAAVIAVGMFYEWLKLTPDGLKIGMTVPVIAFLLPVALLIFRIPPLIIFLSLIAFGAMAAVAAETRGQGIWVAIGFGYAGLSGFALAVLRGSSDEGLVAVLFLFAVVWATDIFAYFAGRAIGGAKLAPSISPGKTWSGAVGGAIGGVLAGLLVAALTVEASYGLFVLALLLSAVSQIGDLFESAVKRRADAKDSSQLIPGHGGIMDRVDGLVAAAATLYVIGALGGSLSHPAANIF